MAHRLIEAPATRSLKLDERCLGSPDDERSWVGISPNDRWLLRQHLERGLCRGWELFFAVPATRQVMPEHLALTDKMVRLAALLWPHRMDVVAERGGEHWIIELKPCASYLALGQLMFYGSRARDLWSCLEGAGLAVLTDRCETECGPVFAEQGVVVHELEGVEPLPIGNIKT